MTFPGDNLRLVIAGPVSVEEEGEGSIAGASPEVIRIPIALVSTSSAQAIPAGAIVTSAKLDITTPYSALATISLGQAGSVAEFMATTDNTPQGAALYTAEQDTVAASTNPLLVTIAGAPVAGAGFAIIEYVATPFA